MNLHIFALDGCLTSHQSVQKKLMIHQFERQLAVESYECFDEIAALTIGQTYGGLEVQSVGIGVAIAYISQDGLLHEFFRHVGSEGSLVEVTRE